MSSHKKPRSATWPSDLASSTDELETIAERTPASRGAPRAIGPFRIVRVLGRGGMGTVYLAEQSEPIKRLVAIKLIRSGAHSKELMRRFESERQALALMNHPNIAQVYEAGALETGQPYFVMEYVRGAPLLEVCDGRQLDLRARLGLFIDICHGVHHAHQKGVVHRDLKPSNILLQESNRPIPKIIDFGIAKALDAPLTEESPQTERLLGTPAYMSPERISSSAGSALDIRTDIYSLGVILYELLVGVLPFQETDGGVYDLASKIIGGDLARPSTKLSTLAADTVSLLAQNRRLEVPVLSRALDGDLDWITMKAMSKEPERRYASANEFAADLERHLRHEPVLAGPPSRIYRCRKFARRHRTLMIAVVLLLASLAAGVAGTVSGLLEARKQARTANAISDFLERMMESPDPYKDGTSIKVIEVLERAANEVEREFKNDPEVKASLLKTIGDTYSSLGQLDRATGFLDQALAIRLEHLGRDHLETLDALNSLASTQVDRGDFASGEERAREVLLHRRRRLGVGHRDTLTTTHILLGALILQGKVDEAESLGTAALTTSRESLGPEDRITLILDKYLDWVYLEQGNYKEAERLSRGRLEILRRTHGDAHALTLDTLNSLAVNLSNNDRTSEAIEITREIVDSSSETLGEEHPFTLIAMSNLGFFLSKLRQDEEAESVMKRLLDLQRRVRGEEHPETLVTTGNLAMCLNDQGRAEEALELLENTLLTQTRILGESHPRSLTTTHNLATVLLALDEPRRSSTLLRVAFPRQVETRGADHPTTIQWKRTQAQALIAHEDFTGAEQIYLDTLGLAVRLTTSTITISPPPWRTSSISIVAGSGPRVPSNIAESSRI